LPTIKDIAKFAGVSQGTVSNVINEKGNVSSEKIRLVEDAIGKLNYNTNIQAQKLRRDNVKHISIILPDIEQQFYSIFYSSLKPLFEDDDYDTSLFLTGNIPEMERLCIQKALSNQSEYIIIDSCTENPNEYQEINTKIIFINNPFIKPGVNRLSISFDFDAAAASFTGHICAKKYKNVALLLDSPVTPAFKYFFKVIEEKLRQNSVNLIPFWYDPCQIFHGAMAILRHNPKFDLIITGNPFNNNKLKRVQDFLDSSLPEILSFNISETIRVSQYPCYELDFMHLARLTHSKIKANFISEKKAREPVLIRAKGFSNTWDKAPGLVKGHELSLLTVTSPTSDILANLAPYFKQCTGIKLKIAVLQYDELSNLLVSGKTGGFDLIRVDTSWNTEFMRKLYYPLDKLSNRVMPLYETFLPAINKIFLSDMKNLYSIPLDLSIQLLFYRKDIFENASIKRLYYEKTREKLEVPRTYEEYNRIAAFFTASFNPSSPVLYGSAMVYGSATVAASEVLPRVKEIGGEFFDKTGKVSINNQIFKKAIENYLELKSFSNPTINYWWDDALKEFSAGHSAMTIIYINQASGIIKISEPGLIMKVGAAPVPGNFPLLGGGMIGISKESKKIDSCLDFFDWIYSDEIANMITLLGGLSPCRSVFENEEILAVYPWLRNMEEHYPHGWRRISSKRHPSFDIHQFEQIFGNAVRISAMGIASPEEALAKAQTECDLEFNG